METWVSVLFKDGKTLSACFVHAYAWFNTCLSVFMAKSKEEGICCSVYSVHKATLTAGVDWLSTKRILSNYLMGLSAVPRAKMDSSVYLKYKTFL